MKMDIKIDEELIINEKWEEVSHSVTKRKASLNANYCDGKKRKDSALKVSFYFVLFFFKNNFFFL